MPARSFSPSSDFADRDHRLLADFRSELREFLHFSEEAARQAGLHPRQHQALLVICGAPDPDRVTVGDLAEKLKIRHHTAVELAHRMDTEGLIRKEHDPVDGRRVFLRLTSKGGRRLGQLSASHKAELVRVGPVFKTILTHLGIFP